jgi:hypothetical protein
LRRTPAGTSGSARRVRRASRGTATGCARAGGRVLFIDIPCRIVVCGRSWNRVVKKLLRAKTVLKLCAKIAKEFSDYNPAYIFTKSLSSTAIETAHDQEFFVAHLPRLTDVNSKNKKNFTYTFLEDLVFKALA